MTDEKTVPEEIESLLSLDQHALLSVKIALAHPNLSPYILQQATGAPLDVCITMMSHVLVQELFGPDEEAFEEDAE